MTDFNNKGKSIPQRAILENLMEDIMKLREIPKLTGEDFKVIPICTICENCLSIDVDGIIDCALLGMVKMRIYCKSFKVKEELLTPPKKPEETK